MEKQKLIDMALEEAKRKKAQDKLFSAENYPENNSDELFKDGDPETIYSIASLYSQFATKDHDLVRNEIENVLLETYPEME